MPQKPLTSKGKKAGPVKKQAANKHGKAGLGTKKGEMEFLASGSGFLLLCLHLACMSCISV